MQEQKEEKEMKKGEENKREMERKFKIKIKKKTWKEKTIRNKGSLGGRKGKEGKELGMGRGK